ncbi:MAG: hypothetical protein HPY44_11820 [Armatimonadetes bacterium]|nr:hypothetical protein [Armatimonadota bacterium]
MAKPSIHTLGVLAASIAAMILVCAGASADETASSSPPINLNIKDAPISEVMTMLSEASGVNIVVGQDVTGTIESVNLRNVSVEDALRYIALSAGLFWYKEDSGYIVTARELPAGALLRNPGAGAAASVPVTIPPKPAVPARTGASLPTKVMAPVAPASGAGPASAPVACVSPVAITRPAAQQAPLAAGYVPAPIPAAPPAAGPAPMTTVAAVTAPVGSPSRVQVPSVGSIPAASRVPSTGTAPATAANLQPGVSALGHLGIAAAGRPSVPAVPVNRSKGGPAPVITPGGRTAVVAPSVSASALAPGASAVPVAPATPPKIGPSAAAPAASGEEATKLGAATEPTGPETTKPDGNEFAQLPGGELAAPAYAGAATPAAAPAPSGSAPQGEIRELSTTLIPVKYADPAYLATLLGGTVAEANYMRPGNQYSPGRRARAGGVNNAITGAGGRGADELWMQGLELGGGLGRGAGGTQGGFGTGGRGSGRSTGGTQFGGRGGQGQGLGMRPEGVESIIAYMPQNSLLVSGDPAAIDQLREVLAILDQPVKQVEISTKFIEVDVTEDNAFGIDWFVSNGSLEFFNLGFAPGEAVNNVVRWAQGKFEATLGVLENMNRGQIINEPHVTTQNNVPAYISFYTTIPYFSASITYNEAGRRDVEFEEDEVDIEQTLEVTPRINADDTVTMYLTPIMEDQTGVVVGPNGEQVPIVASQEVETQVTVADGETIVLGGMIRKQRRYNTRSTPLLSEIPIIGKLFKSVRDNTQNSELLIFVTPRIMRDIPAP